MLEWGRPILIALERQRFLLDVLSKYPLCLFCQKKQSLMMELGGTGVLPRLFRRVSPGWGVDNPSNYSSSYKAQLWSQSGPSFDCHGQVAFFRIPQSHQYSAWMEARAVSSWGLMAPECTLSDAPQSKSQTQTFPCPPPPTGPLLEWQNLDTHPSELGSKERKRAWTR